MHKLTALLLMCCCRLVTVAQITITPVIPPSGMIQKSQLWNVSVVNSGQSPVTVSLNISLTQTGQNAPAMIGRSASFTIAAGSAQQTTANDLQPLQYNYLSPLFNVDQAPNGFLAVANYTACYTVTKWNGENDILLAEQCMPLEVQPLSPPMLNLPADTSTLAILYPQFSWIPPAPLHLFSNLTYDFLLVKVLQNQSSQEAIQQNIPVFNQSNLTALYMSYPASFSALDTGTRYAWRIIAKNEGQPVAQSEVWTFRIKQSVAGSLSHKGGYVKLDREYQVGASVAVKNLKIEYNNFKGDTLASFKIFRLSDPENPVQSGNLVLKSGQNLISVPLENNFSSDELYVFKLVNSRQEEWVIKFIYRSNETGL